MKLAEKCLFSDKSSRKLGTQVLIEIGAVEILYRQDCHYTIKEYKEDCLSVSEAQCVYLGTDPGHSRILSKPCCDLHVHQTLARTPRA